jgi:hypothetical protein
MSGKALRILVTLPLFLAGCAVFAPQPADTATPDKSASAPAIRPSSAAAQTTPRRVETRTRSVSPRPKPVPSPSSATVVAAPPSAAIISKPGAPATQPVPLFRQAIVLANVRAAVAGLPAPPQAEFRHGLLTLRFRETTPDQVAAAVNRAMSVPEVTRVQVIPAP